MRVPFLLVVGFGGLLVLAACGKPGSETVTGEGSSAPFTLAITGPFALGTAYQPPQGITVVSFSLTITSALLEPGNVSLINAPVSVELTQLQTDNNLIESLNVPTGNYETLVLTFANPDMTIFNGTINEIHPTLNASSLTFYPGLALTANTPEFIEIVFSLDDGLVTDSSLNLTAATMFEEPPSVAGNAELIPLNTVLGVVTGVGTNEFTLGTTGGGSLNVNTTSATRFAFPPSVCPANSFRCLAKDQIISADMSVLGSTSIQANTIAFEDDSSNPTIEGIIVGIASTNPPQFNLVIHGVAPATTGIDTGDVVKVTLGSPTNYAIDADGLTVPSGYTFAADSDLVVGQEVLVRGNSVQVVSGSDPSISISTNQLTLRQAQWTATVGVAKQQGTVFTLASLPNLFTTLAPTPIKSLYVATSSQTNFYFTGPSSLAAGLPISVKGLVFNNRNNDVGAPTVIASTVAGAPNLLQEQGN